MSKSFLRDSVRPRLLSAFLILIAILVSIFPSTSVYAKVKLPSGREDEFVENSILFYDPNGKLKEECNDYIQGTSKPSGDEITWIGDSYTVMAENYKLISGKFPGVDIHSKGSKHWYMDAEESKGGESGLTILKNLPTIRKYVVFALGTNDPSGLISGGTDYIAAVEDVIGSGRTLVVVTPRIHSATENVTDPTYQTVYDQLKEAAKNYSNIIIADWRDAVEKDGLDKNFTASSDVIHPNKTGFELWVNTIYGALPGGVSTLPGNSNAEKIWNYLVDAGINDPKVISGILGNLKRESGLDPFLIPDGENYHGLWQYMDTYNGVEFGLVLKRRVEAAVGSTSYWHKLKQKATAPQDAVDTAIKVELDILVKEGASDFNKFIAKLGEVDDKTPEAYAELFMVVVEKCTPGSEQIMDSGVRRVCNSMYSSGCGTYQGAGDRRRFAEAFYKAYLGQMTFAEASNLAKNSSESEKFVLAAEASTKTDKFDADGWIIEGTIPGMSKQSFAESSYTTNDTIRTRHETSDGRPNKILLHNTEGSTNAGLATYAGNMYPPHFTIDLKKKTGYQHFSLAQPSLAIATYDQYAGIQIEIVGFSAPWPSDINKGDYYLPNFTANDWDYLATVLIAISEATGIPLTSTVNWEQKWTENTRWTTMGGVQLEVRDWINSTELKLSEEQFKNYSGILAHMHAPKNDHSDFGNATYGSTHAVIWDNIKDAISRNPDAGKFSYNSSSSVCDDPSYGGGGSGDGRLVSGGMTLDRAKSFMQDFIDLVYKYPTHKKGVFKETIGGDTISLYFSGCRNGSYPLANCATFSEYFVNRYTTNGPDITSYNGKDFVGNLNKYNGFKEVGTVPRVYAVFSIAGATPDDAGHTGIVLGIDEDSDSIIIGESGCSSDPSWTAARRYSLSAWRKKAYTYAYTDNYLKGGMV